MKVNLKKQAVPYKITFTEDAANVKTLIEAEYEKIKENVAAPGFRKGNVPREVAERQSFFNKFDAYRGIFDICYKKALDEQNLQVVEAKDFQVIGPFDDKSPLSMIATILLKPEITSFDLNKIKVVKNTTPINDKLVNARIEAYQNNRALFSNMTDPDYIVKKGDNIIMDFSGKVDGKEFTGGTAKAYKYSVGNTQFIAGFEDQMLKIKLNETGIVKTVFPDNYFKEELRKKDVEFTVTIRKIESKTMKTVEELAADEQKTVEQYKGDIYNQLVEEYAKSDEDNFQADVIANCIKSAIIDPIPDVMIQWELDNEWNQLLYRMGMTEEEYLKKTKHSKDVFYAQQRLKCEKSAELKLFLDHVCNKFNITVTSDEVKKFVLDRASKLQKSDDEKNEVVENLKKEQNYAASAAAANHDKAVTFLIEQIKHQS